MYFLLIRFFALPGSGTEADPYRIESKSDFNDFAGDSGYWGSWVRLDTNLDLSSETYNTAAVAPDTDSSNETFGGTVFSGVFDGNDHSISNLTIDTVDANNDYLGLFGRINSPGEVKNLAVVDCNIIADDSSVFIGGLTGASSSADITDCYTTVTINTGDYSKWIGGLIGYVLGSIEDSYSTGSIQTGDYAYYLGGLTGQSDSGDIIESYSTCSIDDGICSGLNWIGGLAGFKNNGGLVSGCYSSGNIMSGYSAHRVGGLIGKTYSSSSDPNIYIEDCNSSSTITLYEGNKIGGLVGYNYPRTTISNSFSEGTVRFHADVEEVGGLTGKNGGNIVCCWSSSPLVSGDPAATAVYPEKIGGLAGSSSGEITRCYAFGSIGKPLEGDMGYVNTCFATEAGGLVGRINGGLIEQSYAAGPIWGNSYVGGLIGLGNSGDVNECYSVSSVIETGTGTSNIGGLTGSFSMEYGTVTNCFWDTGASGQFESAAGTGKTAQEMREKSTFTDAGWDFENTWDIKDKFTYPYLLYYNKADINADEVVNFKDLAVLADNWLDGTE